MFFKNQMKKIVTSVVLVIALALFGFYLYSQSDTAKLIAASNKILLSYDSADYNLYKENVSQNFPAYKTKDEFLEACKFYSENPMQKISSTVAPNLSNASFICITQNELYIYCIVRYDLPGTHYSMNGFLYEKIKQSFKFCFFIPGKNRGQFKKGISSAEKHDECMGFVNKFGRMNLDVAIKLHKNELAKVQMIAQLNKKGKSEYLKNNQKGDLTSEEADDFVHKMVYSSPELQNIMKEISRLYNSKI